MFHSNPKYLIFLRPVARASRPCVARPSRTHRAVAPPVVLHISGLSCRQGVQGPPEAVVQRRFTAFRQQHDGEIGISSRQRDRPDRRTGLCRHHASGQSGKGTQTQCIAFGNPISLTGPPQACLLRQARWAEQRGLCPPPPGIYRFGPAAW